MLAFHAMKTRLCLLSSLVLGLSLHVSLLAAAAPPPDSGAGFTKFVDDYFDARFDFSPTEGTSAGLHQYDTKMPDRSRGRIERRIAELKAELDKLMAFDRAALPFDDGIDAAALEGAIRSELLTLDVLRNWERNPMTYAGVTGGALNDLIKRDFAPASDRLVSVTARVLAVPSICANGKANVKNPSKEFTTLAIRMAKGSVGFLEGGLTAWAKGASAGHPERLTAFQDANGKAVRALKEFAEWLEKDLLPRSNGAYAIGPANFAAKLKYDEMIDAPLSEVLARGEANLAKDYAAFVETAKKIDPAKTPAEVMKSLSDDHPAADDLIPYVAKRVEAARQLLVDKQIGTIPSEVRPKVVETPPFARIGSFASMDTPGAYETKATEAYYYVTPVEADWDAKHREEHLRLYNATVVGMINVHEVWPGHYLQFLNAPKFKTKTRKLIFCGTNAEGWAHYAEQMMVDEGFGGGDPKMRLAQLQEALLRDCRYVVGIKLHTQGMTVEEGAKVFVEKGFQEPANGLAESRRGAYNPTYLYYTLGKLEIQKLRDEYRAKTGSSLKQFHDAFVAQGGLPIPLVRKLISR